MRKNCKAATCTMLAVLGLFFNLSAHAATMLSGSSLLTTTDQSQLENWLGEGHVSLTNVYTKSAGDTALNFHQAADGRGRTFSVMQASNELGQTWLIGGYNPQSWNSSSHFNLTAENKDRTAFLFNLTSGSLFKQTPKTYALDTVGAYQTYNAANYGPTFGIGHDLFVPDNLTTGGYSMIYSYIDPDHGEFGVSLLDGSAFHGGNITYGAIEVFSIRAIPEPGSYGMMLAGLGLLGVVARRQRGKAA